MDQIKFSDIKVRIIDAINTNAISNGINEPTALIDGFINQPLQLEFTGGMILGGPAIPMVAVVGTRSGRLYFFALKILLPDIKI